MPFYAENGIINTDAVDVDLSTPSSKSIGIYIQLIQKIEYLLGILQLDI